MNTISSLTNLQKQAIECEGCVVVVAGPGTGKTKTLTAKISHLISKKNISAAAILALTFTKKASEEMKDRLKNLDELPYISTFHGLAYEMLKAIGKKLQLISDQEKDEILEIIQQKNSDKKINRKEIKELSLHITRYKNDSESYKLSSPIVKEYDAILKERGVVDYDDLLLMVYASLKNNDKSILQFKNQFTYILVDEFQDTNDIQYKIIKILLKNNNLFVIGDPYQSIYSFRGAESAIFQRIKKDFPNFTEISLDTNYRSVQKIITASSAIFPAIHPLKSVTFDTGNVFKVKTSNEYTEAEYIVETINKKIGGMDLIKAGVIQDEKREINFSDFAIIYRTHSIGRILEKKFIESGIPYQIVGGRSIYEYPEVVFVINYLQYVYTKDNLFLKSLCKSPILNLESKSKRKLVLIIENEKPNNLQLLRSLAEQLLDSKKDIQTISTFFNVLIYADGKTNSDELSRLIHTILKFSYLTDYIAQNTNRKLRINSFLSTTRQFTTRKDSLKECIQYLQFLEKNEFYDPYSEKVTLLTMHASKGLEFKYVFICGVEDGIIPMKTNGSDIEEEKRLLYVAMTRAKHELYLIMTLERNKKASIISPFYSLMSKYVTEIEDEAILRRQKQIKKWKEKKSQLQLFS